MTKKIKYGIIYKSILKFALRRSLMVEESFEIEENTSGDKRVWNIHELDECGQRVRIIAAFYVYKMAEKTLRALNRDREDDATDELDKFLDKYDKLLRKLCER